MKRKLTLKIYLALIVSFVGATIAANLLVELLFLIRDYTDIPRRSFFWLNALSVICGGIISAVFIQKILIKRIKKLNAAVKAVAQGDYDVRLETRGKDELSLLAADFNVMADELKANEYLSKEFVKNLSHELKTPVSSIKGYADLIGKGVSTPQETLEYAQIIARESARLNDLSRQMLSISLLESKTVVKKDDIFGPGEQVRTILLLTQQEWARKNIDVGADINDFEYTGNEELTYLVWQNLISNAVKYTGENGKIDIRLYMQDGRLRFEIKDTGCGIPEQDKPHIFNQFFTGDKSRGGKSTGLGLSLVKKIIEKLDGAIRFESEEGKGSAFYVTL